MVYIDVDSNGDIYVTDYDNKRIVKMNSAGQCLLVVSGYGTGSATAFLNLTGVAVDSNGNIWAADYGKKLFHHITTVPPT
ncbi:MAG: hypothetical protein SFH39_07405 [Candidatus Magnetobacterium sp. LHC-1]|uniref:NHL repeat containing protein n=1 Tax=Candidatus Magnetobacterium casense TaxID=1455061 RepID=A0ABS6RYK0_9BACT|nr:hypothetical protein [Nitrospirota bacterium]MBV6341410.1 hypothetical protein [Candidatus Magnetobacterium casensis]